METIEVKRGYFFTMDHKEHAGILIQAPPYIQELYGKIIIVKYGGNAMISEELRETVINDIILMKCIGIEPIVVHGGGPDISKFLSIINLKKIIAFLHDIFNYK